MARKFRESLKNGEALAIDQRADLMELLMADAVPPNEEIDGATIVHIRGPLEHHNCGFGDSYEAIRERFGEALAADPPCIVLKIDSPGGVVSGLNQAVYDMTRAKEAMGKHVIVYADEGCASAAYAIACVADEIILPPSGIVGSVGVISHMFDVVSADKKEGLNFVVITSGDQKADGHEHVTISEEAIAREKGRVDKLAQQFFRIVKKARSIDAAPLEAGIFLGDEAVKVGIADAVMGWEQLLVDIAAEFGNKSQVAQPGTTPGKSPKPTQEANMVVTLRKMIAATKKKLAARNLKSAARIRLSTQLSHYEATLLAYKKTFKKVSEEETEEGEEEEEEGGNDTDREEDDMPGDEPKDDKDKGDDDGEEDDEEEEEEEEEEERAEDDDEERAAKSAEEEEDFPPKERKGKAKSAKSKKAEEEEEKALAAVLGGLRGRARGALVARLEKASRFDALQNDVSKLKAARLKEQKTALIGNALRANRITKQHSAMLATKPLSFVKGFLDMHKRPMFNTASEDTYVPMDRGNPAGATDARAHSRYTDEQLAMFRRTVSASGGKMTLQDAIDLYEKKPVAVNGLAQGPKFAAGQPGNERN